MEKINIAEILRHCPKGMELDCTIWDGVLFDHVDMNRNYPIYIRKKDGKREYLTEYGEFNCDLGAKCVIFPKGKTTWEGFQRPFKEGDVLYIDCNDDGDTYKWSQYIFILKNISKGRIDAYCYINGTNESKFEICYLADLPYHPRFATEKEKQKLFKAIKDNGYHWNTETKTLEELIVPKFKVGDKVRYKGESTVITITDVKDNYYFIKFYNPRKSDYQAERILFKDQDSWELVPNKFNISTLNPFDKVLVRHSDTDYWKPAFWAKHITNPCSPFISSYGFTAQAIPFKSNEWLVGTTNDCDEYFKTWE